ncbi:hypothetical protein ACT4MK_36915 [Bradyrhizobium barranii]|uniref:hypothetical protein n=1 Tax=Bradyrhizobium TaxID=374 RepID=UPI003F20A8B3
MRSLFCYAALFTTLISTPVLSDAGLPPVGPSPLLSISSDRLAFELAYTRKLLADEYFIRGDAGSANAEYRSARMQLDKVAPDAQDVDGNERGLLADDISYRQLLIEHGKSFWGGSYFRQPINPTFEFLRFSETVSQLSDVKKKLDELLSAAMAKQEQNVSFEIGTIEQQKNGDVAALNNAKSLVQQRFNGRQVKILSDRKQDIRTRQAEIAQISDGLRKQIASVNAQMSASIASGITSAVGLPDVQSAKGLIEGQSLDKSLLAIADATLASRTSTLARSIEAYSKTAQEFASYYQSVKGIADDVALLQRQVATLRSRSIDELIQVGISAYAQMNPSDQSKLLKIAADPNVKTVVNLARKGGDIRQVVSDYITKNADADKLGRQVINTMIASQFSDFADYYAEFLTRSLPLIDSAERSRALYESLFQGWSQVIANELFDSQTAEAIANSIGANCKGNPSDCRKKVAETLARSGAASLPTIKVDIDRIRVVTSSNSQITLFEMKTVDFVSRVLKREMDLTQSEAQRDANELLTRMLSIDPNFSKSLVSLLPNISFDEQIESLIQAANLASPDNGDKTRNLGRKILSEANSADRKKAETEIASFAAGSALAAKPEVISRALDITSRPPPNTNRASPQDPNQQLALKALSMTGPYGAAIAFAVQIVSSMGQMNDLVAQANRLHDEDLQLTIEALHIEDLIQEARLSDALAELDSRIAERQATAALAQRDVLQAAFLNTAADRQSFIRKAKLLMPRFWLLAELCRSQFEALDRSLSTWVGNPTEKDGEIESTFRNAAWARYSLDGDIKLYQWLDRSIEGERSDLDQLVEHWKRLLELARQYCSRQGCDGHGALINQYNVTDELSLSALLTASDLQRLRNWQSQADGPQSIELPFFLSEKSSRLPANLEAVRFADAAISAFDGQRGYRPLPSAQLAHSGAGYLKINHRIVRESFIPQTKANLSYIVDAERISDFVSDLPQRWTPNGVSLGKLEGYPLFSLYVLTIFRSEATSRENMADVRLRLFYSFRSQNDGVKDLVEVMNAQHFWIECEGSDGSALMIPIDQVEAIVPAKAVYDAGDRFRSLSIAGGNNCKPQARQ